MFDRMKLFGKQKINKGKIANKIFDQAATPVLVLDKKQELLMANAAAKEFFDLGEEDANVTISSLFEITREDAKSLFDNIISGFHTEECQVQAQKNGAICKLNTSVIHEGEEVYVIVFVHDMTADYAMIERLKTVTSSLENALEEKSKQVEAVAFHAVTTVANFIDSKEEYNQGHSTRVAKYAQAIAKELGWSAQEARNIHYVALLHDIGKIGVPIDVLNKKTALTTAEQELIKKHTVIGAEILKDIKTVENASEGAMYHHEKYDGSGYPYGLEGQDIPIVARIIAIADAIDAMTSDRKYRVNLSDEEACDEIRKYSGTQFDPYISSVVIRMFEEGIFEKLRGQVEQATTDDILIESNALMAKVMSGELATTRAEAENDYLTQIWNRRNGERHITEYLRIGDGALIIIDLDNFKMVNDTYGHLTGDRVLKEVADILRTHGQNEYVCRMAGDEFLIFVRDVITPEETKPMIDTIMYAFNSRCEQDEILANTSLSIGVALSAQEGRDYSNLFRCADRALYFVKQNGKGGYSFHNRTEYGGAQNAKVDLDKLVCAIKNKDNYSGAYRVEYQRFLEAHDFVGKFAQRNHQNVQLVLLTIDFDKSVPMDFDERDTVMHELELSVTKAMRGVDISTRFSSAQLLMILVDAIPSNVPQAVQRMLHQFYTVYRPTDVKVSFETADITTY
ncbi:MAG: diguanylate cyclase [Lachnospiraceae bacterium]|nr:diguanylate cyclase [Lachnospiraceae bacterium]